MTDTAAADLSDDVDEMVQVTNGSLNSRLERPQPDANTSPASLSSAAAIMDESTGQGFTTAPATSDEDDGSDDDDEEEDDSRSYYSMSNHTTNTNSNMSVMTNGSGGGRPARHYGRLSSGSSGSHGGGGVKGEEKRSHHNVLERKRRDLLKDSFARLRDSVPTTQPRERVSRAEILRQAADFIASTAQKNASVRAELDELIRKNRELEEKRAREGRSGTAGASSTSAPGGAPKAVDQTETTIKQES